MAVIEMPDDSQGWLTMWPEPLGEGRWLGPDEVFRVGSDYNGDEPAFSISSWTGLDRTTRRFGRSMSGSRTGTATPRSRIGRAPCWSAGTKGRKASTGAGSPL